MVLPASEGRTHLPQLPPKHKSGDWVLCGSREMAQQRGHKTDTCPHTPRWESEQRCLPLFRVLIPMRPEPPSHSRQRLPSFPSFPSLRRGLKTFTRTPPEEALQVAAGTGHCGLLN